MEDGDPASGKETVMQERNKSYSNKVTKDKFDLRRGYSMELTYKKATIEDLDLLTETRIKVLRAANQLSEGSGKRVLSLLSKSTARWFSYCIFGF